jgi:extradiol dioxygenase family protein
MRPTDDVFHLAIPARDLAEAEHFYSELLGCLVARHYDDRITFNF